MLHVDFFGDGAASPPDSPSWKVSQDRSMRRRDEDAVARDLEALGFRDGREAAHAGALQKGFDEGFKRGARRGWRLGNVYGAIAGAAWTVKDQELKDMLKQMELDLRKLPVVRTPSEDHLLSAAIGLLQSVEDSGNERLIGMVRRLGAERSGVSR
jgi:hypothetical protein